MSRCKKYDSAIDGISGVKIVGKVDLNSIDSSTRPIKNKKKKQSDRRPAELLMAAIKSAQSEEDIPSVAIKVVTGKLYERCFYCQRKFGSKFTDIHGNGIPLKKTSDHVVPKSKGGWFHQLNIVSACHKCNSLKGDKALLEFAAFLGAINPAYARLHGYHDGLIKVMIFRIHKLRKKEERFLKILRQIKK